MNLSVRRFNETYITIVDENGSEISLVWSRHVDSEAIARLFAAAPELLEALELISSCDETCYVDGHGYIDIEDIAKKAISKAKGE